MQDKEAEINVGNKGLKHIDPKDFEIQSKTKKIRLQKLGLVHLQGQFVLDAGCGPGTYGLILAEQGNNVVGIDISIASVKMAKQRAKTKGVNSSFLPILADLENLPLRNEVFDVCFFGWALHHFPTLDVLTGLTKVLKKGGKIALAEPNEIHLALRFSRYMENLFKGIFEETGLFTENVSVHTYKDYCKSLEKNGLSITMLTSYYAKEPIIIPRNIGYTKRTLLSFIFVFREAFCAFVTGIHSSLNGTDLLIIAFKK